MLPVRRARGVRALLCPANLAPLAYRARWSWSTTPRRCAIPAGTRRPTPPGSGSCCPRSRAARAASITVSEFSRARAGGAARASTRRSSSPAASTSGSRPAPIRSPRAARSASRARTCSASPRHTARKNLAALVPAARALAARRGRGRGRRRAPAAVRARAGARRPAAARARRRRAAARPLRRRAGVRAAVALRGLRAAGAGGDGVRDAGGGRRRRRAAGDVRRRGRAGRARRRGVRGRADRAAGRRRASASACAPPASRAPRVLVGRAPRVRSTRCSALRSALRRLAGTRQRRRADRAAVAHAPQAGPAERARPLLGRQPRVPVDALDAQLRRRARQQQRGPCAGACAWPFSVVSNPVGRCDLALAPPATTARSPRPACARSP